MWNIGEEDALLQAVEHDDAPEVRARLEAGANSNIRDAAGDSALHLAGSVEVVRLLLHHGATVDARGFPAQTPLHRAAGWMPSAAIRLLLDHGADANACDQNGETPLMAATAAAATLLLSAGAEVNRRLENEGTQRHDLIAALGATALHFAVRREDAVTVAILLAHGAAVNAEDCDGCTPLDWAEMTPAERPHPVVAALLEAHGGSHGPACMRRVTAGEVPHTTEHLWYAVRKGHLLSVLALLQDPGLLAAEGGRILGDAGLEGRLRLVRALLELGVPPGDGLRWAAYNGRVAVVRELLERGADPNTSHALHAATFRGHLTVVRQLLAAGADPNPDPRLIEGIPRDEEDPAWFDPSCATRLLDTAVEPGEGEWHGHPGIVQALVSAGSRFTERTGSTLEEAMRRSMQHVSPYLRGPYADDLDQRDDDGITPLMWASRLGCRESAHKLLSLGANPDLCDPWGRSALEHALLGGHADIGEMLRSAPSPG